MISARDQPVEQGVLKASVIETCRTLTEGGPDAGRRLQDVLEEVWGYPAGRAAIRRMVPDGTFLEEDRADFLGSRIKPVRVATDGPWFPIPNDYMGGLVLLGGLTIHLGAGGAAEPRIRY